MILLCSLQDKHSFTPLSEIREWYNAVCQFKIIVSNNLTAAQASPLKEIIKCPVAATHLLKHKSQSLSLCEIYIYVFFCLRLHRADTKKVFQSSHKPSHNVMCTVRGLYYQSPDVRDYGAGGGGNSASWTHSPEVKRCQTPWSAHRGRKHFPPTGQCGWEDSAHAQMCLSTKNKLWTTDRNRVWSRPVHIQFFHVQLCHRSNRSQHLNSGLKTVNLSLLQGAFQGFPSYKKQQKSFQADKSHPKSHMMKVRGQELIYTTEGGGGGSEWSVKEVLFLNFKDTALQFCVHFPASTQKTLKMYCICLFFYIIHYFLCFTYKKLNVVRFQSN